jgi:flagellar hook-length control protein FliK
LDENGFPGAAGWPADCNIQNRKQRRATRHAGRLAEISPLQRWFVPNVRSEAVAARHAQLGQAARNNFSSPQSSDQASPFAALLDEGASDLSPPPTPPAPTPSAPPGPKAAPRPPDDHAASSSSDTATRTQKPAADSTTAGTQADGAPAPSKESQGDDAAQAALAALAKKAAKDGNPTIDASVVAAVTSSAPIINAVATAASSTAAALIDLHAGDTSDSSASDTSQAATPPADPTADASAPVTPQPVAVPVSLPIIPLAPVIIISSSSSDDASGQAAAQIAALGDALKAGALRGDRASADAAKAGNSADDRAGGTAKPGAKAAAASATPMPQPTDAQNSLTGAGQGNSANGAQSGEAAGISAARAAAERARLRAKDSQPNDASPQDDAAGTPNVDPNAAAKPEPVGSTGRIEDIVRQALDTTVRRVEAATAEPTGGGAHPGGASADSAPQSPDGASGAIAPAALTTSAAPTAATATVTNPTPMAVPIAGLAVEIASHALAGKNRFEIRLDPPELGRIDVRLDVDRDGKVTSRLVVDRPETLDILRRDAPALERSLQEAGLKTADDALQFSLRDQGGSGGQNPYSPNNGSPENAARAVIPDRGLPAVEVATAGYSRVSGTSAGVDIRV